AVIFSYAVNIPLTLQYSLFCAICAYAVLRVFLVQDGPYRWMLRLPVLVIAENISYAWSMYHQAINGLIHGMLFGHTPVISTYPELFAALLVIAVSATLAALSTRYFEQPFRSAGRRIAYRFELSGSEA